MDHDANATRLAKIERFLDAQAPGWQDEARWLRPGRDSGLIKEPLHIDEEQTANDRRALGLPVDGEVIVRAPTTVQPTKSSQEQDEARRTAVLAQLQPYRGMDGVPEWDDELSTDQLEGILTTARARRDANQSGGSGAGLGERERGSVAAQGTEMTLARPGIDDSSAQNLKDGKPKVPPVDGGPLPEGLADNRPGALETPRPNAMPPSQEVALGAANASPETQAALETQQDPARATRAEEQREQKLAGEQAGVDVRPAR
jgi:hypothetical protein